MSLLNKQKYVTPNHVREDGIRLVNMEAALSYAEEEHNLGVGNNIAYEMQFIKIFESKLL